MKNTFSANTFAANNFASGAWRGLGIDILIGYPPGRVMVAYVYVPGAVELEVIS